MCVKYLQVLYHHQSEIGDVISSRVLIQSCWCHGGHTVGFAHCHLFQLLYLSELKAEIGEGRWISLSQLCQAFLCAWFGGAECPWAISRQSGPGIMGSAGPGCWSLAAGSYANSGVTAPASLEL